MFGLRNKFLIVNFFIGLLAGILILLSIKSILHKKLLIELQKRGVFMARHLAKLSSQRLLTEKIFLLQMDINDFKKSNDDIEYIFIKDSHGKVVVHTFRNGFPVQLKNYNELKDGQQCSIKEFSSSRGIIYDIAVPIVMGRLGVAHIGLTERFIKKSTSEIVWVVLRIIFVILFISGMLAILFSMKITKPISKLVEASKEIGAGNLRHRVDIKSKDEIGELAKTFNTMADSLLNSRNRLEKEIAERKITQIGLEESVEFLNSIFDSIRDPFVILDRDLRIIRVNNAYARIKGKPVDSLAGGTCYRILEGRDNICDNCVIEKTFKSGEPCIKEKKVLLPEGSEAWFELYTYPIYDKESSIRYVIEYTRDITGRKKAEEETKRLIKELEELSRTDSLTGVFNRRVLLELLEYNLNRAKRYSNNLSVILCDVDRFKEINDTYGHPVGDVVLKTIAQLMRDTLRSIDIIVRYGGDEFLIMLPETALYGAMDVAERIRNGVEKTQISVSDNININLTLSLGVVDCKDISDVNDILRIVDYALYESKKGGRNRIYASGLK
jgi:diguanylate cyclase (GGDEF)-like protein/PAS domain S-box-containing protein